MATESPVLDHVFILREIRDALERLMLDSTLTSYDWDAYQRAADVLTRRLVKLGSR